MKEQDFHDWLVKSGQKENSASSVVSRVKRIEDAYPDLDSRIEDNSIEALLNVFIYTKKDEAKRRIPLHKIEIEGNPYTGTQSLRTALAQYIEFRHTDNPHVFVADESKTCVTEPDTTSTASDDIYEVDEFRGWMSEFGNMKESSAGLYISYLKALGKCMTKKSDGSSVLGLVYSSLREDNTARAFEIMEKVDEKLTSLLSSHTVSSEMKRDLNNWRSAVRKYVDFLQDEIEDIPDEEALEEAGIDTPTLETYYSDLNDVEEGDVIEYTLDALKKNFAFRLNTQNRMSNDKDIFYPISIIRKLFCYSQRNGKRTTNSNNDYDWFKDWTDDYVGEVKVLLNDKGDITHTMSDVRSLLLYPATGNVYVQISNIDGNLQVYSQKTDGEIEPLKANKLRNIHIDHTPLMADVLSDNISRIPAINTISNEIKAIARAKKIDICPKNFGKISKALFADSEYVKAKLLPLIPAIKNELNILRKKCTLTLMQASHNLRKK